jgi:DNA-binding response OmpR family regulator
MRKAKILIIDDDRELLDLMEFPLKREGYLVITAIDGVDGLRLATEEHPDLILLDVMMPVMDGYAVLEKIKDRRIPTRVVMMSALRTETTDVVGFTKLGACDYLIKPFDVEALLNTVRRALVADTTINLRITDTPPIIEQLIATTEKLERDKGKLEEENEKLKEQVVTKGNTQQLILIAIRLLCLVIAVAISILLYYLKVISNTQALVIPFIVFFLLLLPIERIKKLSVKVPKVETGVEIDEKDK